MKTEQAPTPMQRMYRLAAEFRRRTGTAPEAQFSGSDYSDFTRYIRVQNTAAAEDALRTLLQKKTYDDLQRYYRRWSKAPFTGSSNREGQFVRSLSPEQKQVYWAARKERLTLAQQAVEFIYKYLKAHPKEAQLASTNAP